MIRFLFEYDPLKFYYGLFSNNGTRKPSKIDQRIRSKISRAYRFVREMKFIYDNQNFQGLFKKKRRKFQKKENIFGKVASNMRLRRIYKYKFL